VLLIGSHGAEWGSGFADDIAEPSPEAFGGLGCQGYFRDEDDRVASGLVGPLDGAEVDLGFAAPGDPVEQCDARATRSG
jgi:hypothetical protein